MPTNKTNVYKDLKEHIQFLEMEPGARIVEADLSKEFGVSRTPIREALKQLEEEQLIEIYPQKGTYVAKIDITLVKEMAYMRHILENKVLTDLCREKTPVRQRVEKNLVMMKLALKNNDYKAYIRQDAKFHKALFECGSHGVMWDTIAGFLSHYTRILVLDMMLPEHLERSYESHEKIVDCIETGDIKRLQELLEDHHDHRMTEADEAMTAQHPMYFN